MKKYWRSIIVPFAGKVSFTGYAGPVIEDGTTTVKLTPVVPAPTSGGAAVKAVGRVIRRWNLLVPVPVPFYSGFLLLFPPFNFLFLHLRES